MWFKKKIYYMNVEANLKEDLIGSYYKCPWCEKKIKITQEGISHEKNKHMIHYNLEGMFNMYKANKEWSRKMARIWFNLD